MIRAITAGVFSLAILLLMRGTTPSAEPAAQSLQAVRTAIARSLPLLQKGAEGHTAQRTCFACHNQAIPILAFTTVRGRGFSVREDDLKKQLEFIAAFLKQNRENYRQGKGQGGQVDTAGYALLALELGGWKPDATTQAVVEYLLLRNKDLDHWRTTSNRPPSEVSDFTPTYLAIRGLRRWGVPGQQERIAKRIEAVRGWLIQAQAQDTEDRVFRLWALQAAEAGEKFLQSAARELAQSQRPDGGWAQMQKLDSDTYATGSAIVALHQAGGMPTDDPVYQRGVGFLLKTQEKDGSWLVHSRSKPFQTYYESGFPHGKDQFISIAASAWATTALALAYPPALEAKRPLRSMAATALESIPDRLVVMTFDDSAKSHFTVARPLLKRLGFGATFFITEGFDFRDNKQDYMTWEEIAQLHRDGFEIGNHTRDHRTVTKGNLQDLAAQVRGINARCRDHGIPVPVSFAYPGNGFDLGALPILREQGIKFARRGGMPEYSYKDGRGFAFEPGRDHPLLIPSAGDARPTWTLKDFQQAVEQAGKERIAVLQFHGVPDTAHDWVNTSKSQFETYMNYLSEHHYKVIAMRDLAKYVDPGIAPDDPLKVIAERKDPPRRYRIVASGNAAGGYAAFPDVCRTKSGDLFCVFYSGYGHVSKPSKDWPNGGRVMAVRSTDDGETWGKPFVLADTVHDDRDPHIAALKDGTLVCNWFVAANPEKPLPGKRPVAIFFARSTDNGKTWTEPAELKIDSPYWFACSAPIRELPDGALILGLYTEDGKAGTAFGATIKSYDGGKTWKDLSLIGEKAGLYLDAETDVIRLKDDTLLGALRSSKTDLYLATSKDGGKSWGKVYSSGFKGHCPHFLRHSSGAILLSHRLPATAVHWSFDEGRTWQGPLQIDSVGGAYPSCVELSDGRVYCVYYEEGAGSSIRGMRLKVSRSGVSLETGQ